MLAEYNKLEFILASKSPRRQSLFAELGFHFTTEVRETDETYPSTLPIEEVPAFLAQKKAQAFFSSEIKENQVLITADTLVLLQGNILGKPSDKAHAIEMLQALSGNMHQVITGVCLKSATKEQVFSAETKVYFRELTSAEILYYVENYEPYDKAGAYGIQEWIGFVGVEKVEGSYFNVMGLPTQKLFQEIKKFI